MIEAIRRAVGDIGAALRLSNVWMALASEDVVDSHRRTMLGPVWPLLNYLLFVGTILLIIGHGGQPVNFTAYVASGLLVWLFISETLTLSATLFVREQSFVKGTVLPISVYVLRQTMLAAIRAGYALAGAIPLILFSGVAITPAAVSIVPAVLLLLITALAVTILFGFAGVFFRDFQFVVTNAMRLMIFITPVFWVYEGQGGVRGIFYNWNPATHYIEIIRMPIIDGVVPAASWAVAGSLTTFLCAAAILVLGKFGRQLVFMV
jgi:ABC-type polysaccharide/polyol phosphate export permease